MSRSYCSYNEDWQRRKAILIRSLFHDIQILSPVTEESNESNTYKPTKPTEDILEVPSQPYEDDRPESPLPPLIIERYKAPNRHDEPEEYYQKLLKKITRIYRKLFIENKDLSIEDLNLNSFDSSKHDDNFGMTNLDLNDKSRENGNGNCDSFDNNRESSNSINSNGYAAGSLTSTTSSKEWIDVENYSKSEEDVAMRYEEERQSSNEQEPSESETENSNDMENTRDTNETTESDTANDDQDSIEEEESSHLISADETNESEQSNNGRTEDEQSNKSTESSNKPTKNPKFNDEEIERNNIELNYPIFIDNGTSNNVIANIRESELKSKESERRAFNSENELIASHNEAMDEDIQTNTSSNGTDYMQITTKAIVHVDGCQDDVERESRVYEDSVRSLILPTREFRRIIKPCNIEVEDRIEELPSLEDNEDPDTIFDSVDSDHITEPIEVMRTPQPKISNESILITARSESDISSEYTKIPDNTVLDSVTSSPQDDDNDVSKPKTSDEMNNILTSIFNDSLNKDSVSPLRRKRKLYEDISVQTSHRVTWDELRGNFFVGTPKVYRLCACTDHVCN